MSHARRGCPFTGRQATAEEMRDEIRSHQAADLAREWTLVGEWVS
ncbi:hypothetical protein [Streptomyces sp. NPDC088915]